MGDGTGSATAISQTTVWLMSVPVSVTDLPLASSRRQVKIGTGARTLTTLDRPASASFNSERGMVSFIVSLDGWVSE